MAEITYTGSRGAGRSGEAAKSPSGAPPHAVGTPPPPQQRRPSSASPRLQGHTAPPGSGQQQQQQQQQGQRTPPSGERPRSARHILSFLDAAEAAAGGAQAPSMFPSSTSLPSHVLAPGGGGDGSGGGGGGGKTRRHTVRPRSAAAAGRPTPLRVTGGPRLQKGPAAVASPPPPPPQGEVHGGARRYGRTSMLEHGTGELAPHEVLGPRVLRDLAPPRVGFPARAPEAFLKAGEGLSLRQRNDLRQHLKKFPVNLEAPFVSGTGGVRLSWEASPPAAPPTRCPLPHSLLRTYYDNGTLDFLSVRWRGSRADALAWARRISKGQEGSAHTRSYTAWGPELPSDLDLPTWLPVFVDGIREYDEPYRFLAVRGSEEMMYAAGDTLHPMAESLVAPLKAALDTREPTTVAVALQLMLTALALDARVAAEWVPHYWLFAQVLNLFVLRGGALVVDMGYNQRAVRSCRQLAADFMARFEGAGGEAATAAVRRYSPGVDPAVTDASMARAAAKAAARAAAAGRDAGEFRPFTLF